MKNYIEMFLEDNNINPREVFVVKHTDEGDVKIKVDGMRHIVKEDGKRLDVGLVNAIMGGCFKIEKIKPKTLMEQLKEQGFGWHIIGIETEKVARGFDGRNNFNYLNCSSFDEYVLVGDIVLTLSDAKREVYRRQLEFEMQEWARENDCLGTYQNGYNAAYCFNLHLRGNVSEFRNKFEERINKYYNWRD